MKAVKEKDPATTESQNKSDTTTIARPQAHVKVIVPLKDLISAFVEARDKINHLKEAFDKKVDPLKLAKEEIQAEIIKTFHERGEFTTRIEGATATLSVRKTAVVVDEQLVIKQLKEQGLNDYISESLNDLFESVKKKIADGEVSYEGVEVKETEFISVRVNDKKDPRKLTTEQYTKLERSSNGR